MLELGHAQVGDGDEVVEVAEASGGGLRLLEPPVHRLDVGVAAPVEHAADHAAQVRLDRGAKPLEGFQARASGPADPLHQGASRDLFAVARRRLAVDEPQALLHPPRPRTLEARALQPVHRIALRLRPLRRVLAHRPQQLAQRLLVSRTGRRADRGCGAAHLLAANLVHRRIGQGHDVETVVADLRRGQRLGNPLGVGRAHVDAGVLDPLRLATVRAQVLGKGLQGRVVSPGRGEQQALGLQVMHHGDVRVPALDAGLVDADVAHARHVIPSACTVNVMADPPPQPLGRDAHLGGGLAHGHLPAQRQAQRLEQQGKAVPLTRPRHRQLRGLAAALALHARDLGMQPRFELKEIQMTPAAPHAIVDQLVLGPTRRTRGTTAGVLDLEVDPALACVELDLGDVPGRLQAKRGGEEGFDRDAHGGYRCGQDRGVVPPITAFVAESISTGNGIEPSFIAAPLSLSRRLRLRVSALSVRDDNECDLREQRKAPWRVALATSRRPQ